MSTVNQGRRGFALAVAIFAIVIIGTLVAGVFFASTQEFRIGRNSLVQERALTAAEFGQNHVLARWIKDSANRLAVGDTWLFTYNATAGDIDTVLVTKVNRTTFWVVSEGRAGTANAGMATQVNARRRTGMVITLDIPQIRVPAALTSRAGDTVAGSSILNGNDVNPTGWDCPPSGPAASAVVNPDSAMYYQGTKYQLQGASPQVRRDTLAADTNTYFNLTGGGWDSLTKMATKVFLNSTGRLFNQLGPVVLGTTCVTSNDNNWGDPWRNAVTPGPCETYFPVIHSKGPGTLQIQGGGGAPKGAQGMLLVDGDLEISGSVTFTGLIIVRGRVRITGNGVKVQGGVMTANMNGKWNMVAGDASPTFSRCAINTVLASHAWPKPAKERHWADMF